MNVRRWTLLIISGLLLFVPANRGSATPVDPDGPGNGFVTRSGRYFMSDDHARRGTTPDENVL